jgi:hypothetical protein
MPPTVLLTGCVPVSTTSAIDQSFSSYGIRMITTENREVKVVSYFPDSRTAAVSDPSPGFGISPSCAAVCGAFDANSPDL